MGSVTVNRDIISYGNKIGRIDVTTDGKVYRCFFNGKQMSLEGLKRKLAGYPVSPYLFELKAFINYILSVRLSEWRIKYGRNLKDDEDIIYVSARNGKKVRKA